MRGCNHCGLALDLTNRSQFKFFATLDKWKPNERQYNRYPRGQPTVREPWHRQSTRLSRLDGPVRNAGAAH